MRCHARKGGRMSPTIIIDTREQDPLAPFVVEGGERKALPTVRRKLDVGDYAAEGLEHVCAIERKSPSDLYGTLFGSGKDALGEAASNQGRFRAELLRGQPIPRLYLLVECSWLGFERYLHEHRRRVSPATAMGLIASLDVTYGVRVVWSEDRTRASWFCGFVLSYIYRQATDPREAAKARARGVDLSWLKKEET